MPGYRDLTLPLPGSTSARAVLGESLRQLRVQVGRLPPDLAPGFAPLRDAVMRAPREKAGAVFSALRRVNVGTLVRCVSEGRGGEGGASDEVLVATLALSLARAGALDPDGFYRCPAPPRVASLGDRFVLNTDGAEALEIHEDFVLLLSKGERREIAFGEDHPLLERPYHAIVGDLLLCLFDDNPIAQEEAHPDKGGNAISLGDRPVEEWLASLREALEVIDDHLPDLGAEMALYLQQAMPVGFDAHRHLSASYQEAIGTIYLSLHPNVMTMAEALVHEFSHNKLNAFGAQGPLLDNAFEPLFASPVRPDPRPLHGVLLAVHAFFPVERLYEEMIRRDHPWSTSPDFQRRYADICRLNRDGASTLLDNARWTPLGNDLATELRALSAREALSPSSGSAPV